MNLPDEKREAVAEVLGAHHLLGDTARQLDAAGQCACGEKFYEIGGTASAYLDAHRRLLARHDAHLADALAPLLAGWLAEARAEALREAVDAVQGAVSYGFELRPDGSEDPTTAVYVEGLRDAWQIVKDRAYAAEREA